jgi:DNA polymerase-1
VVDEEIYRRLPTLLIATVDKFAQMPWNGQTQVLFGQVTGQCPRHGFVNPSIDDSPSHPARGALPSVKQVSISALRPPDLIAALLRGPGGLEAAGHGAVIVTSDKDLAQLVTGRVTLLDFSKEERYGPAEVVEKFGVRPEQIADFLGLAGDPVDSIPGVPGVGKKTAVALLAAFGDLDRLYERLDEVPDLDLRGAASCARKLEENRELAFLSRRLATVAVEAPARASPDELAYRGADPAAIDPLFERLGFTKIRERVPRWR